MLAIIKLVAGSISEDYLLQVRALEVKSNVAISEPLITYEVVELDQSIRFVADERGRIQADGPTIGRVNWNDRTVMQS
jgi:hypothetical protein